jgi:hypothetical protein
LGNRPGPRLRPRVFIFATVGCFSCLPVTDQQQVVCGVFINKKLMRNAIDVLYIRPDLPRIGTQVKWRGPWLSTAGRGTSESLLWFNFRIARYSRATR